MNNIILVEFKKLMSSKILWMILAGGFLQAIISALTLLEVEGVGWKGYIHTSMDTYNTLAFFIFASFASFIWAREYEEKMMEVTLLYPYSKYSLLLGKLVLSFVVVICTTIVWAISTIIVGAFYVGTSVTGEDLKEFILLLLPMIVMHFLTVTFTYFFTIITKSILIGAIFGVAEVAVCSLFKATEYIQYIPFCAPLVLSHNMYGFENMTLDSYAVTWGILIATFIIMLFASMIYLRNKVELR